MFDASMRCYLWDLVDEGIDAVLDRLKGEAGITGISVPLACPPIEQLRAHKEVSPHRFRSRGGVQFQPDPGCYPNSRLRPVVAEWLRKSNPLPQVLQACAKRALSFEAVVNCCESPVLVERYPFAAVKDVWGEVNPDRLCPVNADVKQYLHGLAADLQRNYGVQQIAFEQYEAVGESEWQRIREWRFENPAPASALIDTLTSVCFCESCRQQALSAGVGVNDAAREVEELLDVYLFRKHENASKPPQLGREPTNLVQYIAWQNRAADRAISNGNPSQVSLDLAAYALAADLVRDVSSRVAAGLRSVCFTNYGAMPLSRLSWLRQAVRKAQRDSS